MAGRYLIPHKYHLALLFWWILANPDMVLIKQDGWEATFETELLGTNENTKKKALNFFALFYVEFPHSSSKTRSYTPQTICKNERRGGVVVIKPEPQQTVTATTMMMMQEEVSGGNNPPPLCPPMPGGYLLWPDNPFDPFLDHAGAGHVHGGQGNPSVCPVRRRGGGGSNARIYSGGQCSTSSGNALLFYLTSSDPSNGGGMMIINMANRIVTVSSCWSMISECWVQPVSSPDTHWAL